MAYLQLDVNRRRYERRPFPNYRQPVEIGHLSQDEDRTVYLDRREARSYKPPRDHDRLGWDLNEGFSQFKWRDEDKAHGEGISPILSWILSNKKVFDAFQKPGGLPGSLHTDFVMFRGMMTRILCAPYETPRSDPWKLRVCRFQNTIYVCDDAEFQCQIRRDPTPDQKRMTYWGYSFEGFLTSHIDQDVSKATEPNNSAGFATVIRSRLEEHSILVVGEVDGEMEGVSKAPQKYVELKTHRQPANHGQEESFRRFKLRRTWAQCYIPGISTVVFGFRDDQGVVHSLKTFKTSEIPPMCSHLWQPSVCMNFANEFLAWLVANVRETDPLKVVYEVSFIDPFNCMTLQQLPINEERQAFLSAEYVEAVRSWTSAAGSQES